MDSLTQALLGATVQAAVLGRWQGRKALLYGALLGTLPDLDVVIDYGDAVANMTHHRGFSHSLPVLTGIAVLLAGLARRLRPHPGYGGLRLFMAVWLVLITHPLLDAFTSYGTQLLWPLNTPPVAWSSVFIIDPLYSLPLLLAVLAGLVSGARMPRGFAVALGLSTLYLAFTLSGKWMAERRVEQVLARQGVTDSVLFSAPTPFNSLLWRVVRVAGDDYQEALVGWLDREAPSLVSLPRGGQLAAVLDDSPAHARLRWFTGGLLRYDVSGDRLLVTDLRLGMTGHHPFRFPLAVRDAQGWHPVAHPERLPFDRGTRAHLAALWRRIWQQQPELPLADWARNLETLR